MNKAGSFDAVVLGASPVGLLEAAHLRALGYSVVVIDANAEIGGAWRESKTSLYERIDAAPHLITPYHGVNRFLSENLGIEMEDVTAQAFTVTPFPIFGRVLHPYTSWWLSNTFTGEALIRLFEKSDPATKADYTSFAAAQATRFGADKEQTIHYFRQGTGALVRALDQLIERYGVETALETTLEEVEIGTDALLLQTNRGSLRTRSLVLTTYSRCPHLKVSGEQIKTAYQEARSTYLTLRLNADRPVGFRILYFLDHRYLKFVSNVTTHTVRRPGEIDEANVILKVLTTGGSPVTTYAAGGVVSELMALGLLSERTTLLSAEINAVDRMRLSQEFLGRVNAQSHGRIRYIETVSLGAAIYANLRRWRATVNARSSLSEEMEASPHAGFAMARRLFDENAYEDAAQALVATAQKFPKKDLLLKSFRTFTDGMVEVDRLKGLVNAGRGSPALASWMYSLLIPTLMDCGRAAEGREVHKMFLDLEWVPDRHLLLEQAYDHFDQAYGDAYRAKFADLLKAMHRTSLSLALRHVSEYHIVYDVGCGSGFSGEVLRSVAKRLVGIDQAPKFTACAMPGVYDDMVIADCMTLAKVKLQPADLVFAGGTVQYVANVPRLLRSFATVLHAGGMAAFDVIVNKFDTRVPMTPYSSQAFAHRREYIVSAAENCGFQVLEAHRDNFMGNYDSDLFVLRRLA